MSEKIQKILARAGVASRRNIEEMLRENRIKINGKPAKLGDRATDADILAVDGRVVETTKPDSIVLMYHKPEGVVCSRKDDQGRPLIFDQLPKCPQGRWLYVGRLDINSSGLILITNDGELANNLMHPSKHVERAYLARVIGDLPAESVQRLIEGVQLEDGIAKFDSIREQRSTSRGRNSWYKVSVHEGRNRIVRRMFEAVNCTVSRLMRVSIGKLTLPRDLQAGQYRELTKQELELIS